MNDRDESPVTEISMTAEGCRVVSTQLDGEEHIELSYVPTKLTIERDFVQERGRVWPRRS